MNPIKLIVCDLDGTLLDDQERISEYSKEILKKAQKSGIKLCFASGRYEQMMSVYDSFIGGCDYMVSCNGAIVKQLPSHRILHMKLLSANQTALILRYIKEHDMIFMMYSKDHIYYSKQGERLLRRIDKYEKLCLELGYAKKLKPIGIDVQQPMKAYDNIIKIVVYEDSLDKISQYQSFVNGLNGVCGESTGYGLMGTFNTEVSKKTAIEQIMEDMNISKKQVCVFGDYENDLSMFDCAEYKIAVDNATEVLKSKATDITASNNQDGVAKYIKKILEW